MASTKLNNDDVLIGVKMLGAASNTDICIVSDAEYILRFNVSEVNEFKRVPGREGNYTWV